MTGLQRICRKAHEALTRFNESWEANSLAFIWFFLGAVVMLAICWTILIVTQKIV